MVGFEVKKDLQVALEISLRRTAVEKSGRSTGWSWGNQKVSDA